MPANRNAHIIGESSWTANLHAQSAPLSARATPWLLAVALACGAMLLRVALTPYLGSSLPFVIAVPAVLVAAWYGGFWPGILATAICIAWSVVQPITAQLDLQPSIGLRVALLAPTGVLICLLAEQLHRRRREAMRRLEAMERLAKPSQRLQAALELAAIAAFDVDRDLRYVWAQKPPVGLREADMLGRTAEEIYEPAVAAALTAARRRILDNGTAFRTELQVTRNGVTEWVDWIGGPLRDSNGRIVGVTNLAIDITDRKTSELAIRRSGESQRLLVDLQDATAGLTSAAEINSVLVKRVGQHFGVNRCTFADIALADATVDVTCNHTDNAASVVGHHRLGPLDSALMRELLAGRTIALADLTQEEPDGRTGEPLPGEAWMTAGDWAVEGGAVLCVPIIHEAQLVAALSLRHNLPHEWTADEIRLAEQVAQRTWSVIETARAQEALRESREVLVLAMRGGRMGAWSRDFDTDRAWWSRELEEIFGLDAGGFTGSRQDFLDMLHPGDRDRVEQTLDEATLRHQDYVVEYRFRHRSGEWRWMEGRGRTIYKSDGIPSVTYGLGIDITERKNSEEERRRLTAELANALRRKDEFLATLAHELRNPLAPIVTALEVLRIKVPDDPQMQWSRNVIERQVGHMTRLVDDLLDVARISTGKAQLRKERIELSKAVHHALESVKTLIDAAGHKLSLALPQQRVVLEADPTRLSQVFANLLSNAAKYTPPGGSISLRTRLEDQTAVITVSDDGIGLAEADLEPIFNMFAQVTPPIDRAQGGLGIGLALSRGLVELHGGTLTAASPGLHQGSTFTVRLPLAAAAEEPAPFSLPPATARDATLRRILVVDDNLDAAQSLAMLLQMDGHETALAHDGRRALEMAKSFNPEVILLDIGLPLLNGYEVARQVRGQPGGEAIKLIAVTGWGQDQDRQQALAAGFDYHLTKPLDPARLSSLLDGTLH